MKKTTEGIASSIVKVVPIDKVSPYFDILTIFTSLAGRINQNHRDAVEDGICGQTFGEAMDTFDSL